MSVTLTARLALHENADHFLQPIGLKDFASSNKNLLLIELTEKPEILTLLETSGYFEQFENPSPIWYVSHLSAQGITLSLTWLDGQGTFDGAVFIPRHLVVCIHSITETVLARIKAAQGPEVQPAFYLNTQKVLA